MAAPIRFRRLAPGRWQRRLAGFSLFEVLIAILVSGLFFLVLAQSSTLGSANRARALEASESLSWIQQDLESIRFQASRYRTTILQSNAVAGSTSIFVQSSQDFNRQDEQIHILETRQADATVYQLKGAGGNRLDIGEPKKGLVVDHNQGAIVFGVSTSQCQATNSSDGMGYDLRSQINSSITTNTNVVNNTNSKIPLQPLSRTLTSTNKQFIVQRSLETSKSPPYRSLTVRYVVYPPTGTPAPFLDAQGNPREFSTEVIPDAAFYCP